MHNNISAKLKNLLDLKGFDLLSNPRLLKAILLDICPTAPSEINLLLIALQENIPQEVKKNYVTLPKDVLILAMANRLVLNYCIERNKAIWTVKAWVYALGLKSLAEPLPAKALELKPPPKKSPVIATFSGCGTKKYPAIYNNWPMGNSLAY